MEDLRDRLDQQRLRQSRRPGDEAMPAGEQAGQQLLDHFVLADDDFGQFVPDPFASLAESLDDLPFVLKLLSADGLVQRHGRSFQRSEC